jgi:uncharacterized protein YeeX (DUF496 family)
MNDLTNRAALEFELEDTEEYIKDLLIQIDVLQNQLNYMEKKMAILEEKE